MKKVLVVDDAKIMRANLSRMLTQMGYQVVGEAENGFEGVRKYKLLKPDFVTMDISMPETHEVADVLMLLNISESLMKMQRLL